MRCTSPLQAYKHGINPKSGKPFIKVISKTKEINWIPKNGTRMILPCGQCIECRLEKSRQWAIRCMHEAELHEDNHFLTITYNNDSIPADNNLQPKHLTDFIKRVRKTKTFRYFACGEYGDQTDRPHYHMIIFGLKLEDLKYHKTSNGHPIYTSDFLSEKWKGQGHIYIGQVTFESCAYVARYVMKKQNGPMGKIKYKDKTPEFVRMSTGRKPDGGIGKRFYDKFKSDMYQEGTDGVAYVRGGIPSRVPAYYDKLFEVDNPERFQVIKKRREEQIDLKSESLGDPALNARRKISKQRNQMLKRNVE